MKKTQIIVVKLIIPACFKEGKLHAMYRDKGAANQEKNKDSHLKISVFNPGNWRNNSWPTSRSRKWGILIVPTDTRVSRLKTDPLDMGGERQFIKKQSLSA